MTLALTIIGESDAAFEVLASNSALLADTFVEAFEPERASFESVFRGFIVLKSWTYICTRMATLGNSGDTKLIEHRDYQMNLELKFWTLIWPSIKHLANINSYKRIKEEEDKKHVLDNFFDTILFMQSCGSDVFPIYSADLTLFISSLESASPKKEAALYHIRNPVETSSMPVLKKNLEIEMQKTITAMIHSSK